MLAIQSVVKRYADKVALSDVSFNVERGEIVALLGANGSGKTTTIQSICGLVEIDGGAVMFDGNNIGSNKQYLKHIGAVLDGSRNINWRLTVAQNATYFGRLRGAKTRDIQALTAKLEEQLGLSEYRGKEVMKLSTGNKQKASLLCALVHSPSLLLLDEPTLGLDMQTVSELQNIITAHATDAQTGVLITSHDMTFIDRICSKVVVLEQGNVIFNGGVQELKRQLFHYELLVTANADHIAAIARAAQQTCQGKWRGDTTNDMFSLHFEEPAQVLPLMAWLAQQTWQPERLEIQPLNIEKAYRAMVKQEQNA